MNGNLSQQQFNDVYEMKHGDVGMVPTHALHDATSAEFLVPGREIPKVFDDLAEPKEVQETHALTEDVRENGIREPIMIGREFPSHREDPEHWIQDGNHRYLAALRTGQTHVPVRMHVWPPAG